MAIERNIYVQTYEERHKAEAKRLLLAKTEYTIDDIPLKNYPHDFFDFSRSWESAFAINPRRASRNFRKALLLSYNAGISEKVKAS